MTPEKHTGKHLYYTEPLNEEKELKFLLEPLLSEYEVASAPQTAHHEFLVSFINTCPPVLQNGPMCGLVAMTMVSELLVPSSSQEVRQNNTHPELIFEFAKQQGFTKRGEMFSTQYMQHVLKEHLKLRAEILQIQSLNEIKLIELLLSSSQAILVPYDADKNHTPCLAGGHKAHWCVLVGFSVRLSIDEPNQTPLQCTHSSEEGHLFVKRDSKQQFVEMLKSGQYRLDKVHVFARHGKSRHMGLWCWKELRRSNENLLEIDPQRTNPGEYVLPTPGGIREGLSSQIIVVSHA